MESLRTERINRAVFEHAKIVHVLEGCAPIETATGTHEFRAGTAMALGAGRWCTVQPEPSVRMWTVFLDEAFLRVHMRWVLSDVRRALRDAPGFLGRVGADPPFRCGPPSARGTVLASDQRGR